jgi:hypothetical protein
MNDFYGPHSALFGVLVAHPSEPSTASARDTRSAVRIGGVALILLAAALISLPWWVMAA